MSDIHRFLGPVQWKTEKTSEWTIATIISDDVLILPHRANPVEGAEDVEDQPTSSCRRVDCFS